MDKNPPTEPLTPEQAAAADEIARMLAPTAPPASKPANKPGRAADLSQFVTFPCKSPEWQANVAACRSCKHFISALPKRCALTNRQTSAHAIEGTCPTGTQPHRASGLPVPAPAKPAAKTPSTPAIAFSSNVGREKPRPGEPRDFPVDLVVPWVDGSDPAWRAKFKQHVKGSPDGSRYASADELKYLPRSIERFAPWIRTVFILTDDQRPKWLKTSDRVRVVDHREFIPAEYLPTFSSATIEMHIHRIDGLAEHFLYGNDDCFFGNTVVPSDFFTGDGKAIQTLGGSLRASGGGTYAAMRNNAADALDALFGKKRWRQAWHHVAPCRRSALAQMAERMAEVYAERSHFKTRRQQSIATNNGAWPPYHIEAGFGVEVSPEKKLRANYINANQTKDRDKVNRIIDRMPELLCVNNSSPGNVALVRAALEAYFPTAGGAEAPRSDVHVIAKHDHSLAEMPNEDAIAPYEPLVECLRGRRVAYLFNDKWGNWGDRWIDNGTRALFNAAGVEYRAYAQSEWGPRSVADAKSECDVLALFGSGSVGHRCRKEISLSRRRAAKETGLPAVLLPSSAMDSLEDLSYCTAVFARESVSFEMLRNIHRNAMLTPDLAMLGVLPPAMPTRAHGVFFRNDFILPDQLRHVGDPTGMANDMLTYLQLAGQFEIVETNRLHFAIAALRHGRNVVLRPCGWHKAKAYWSTWLAENARVEWRD